MHVHPHDPPAETATGTRLTFHLNADRACDHRMFLQVRVEGLLWTLPLDLTVS